jgi:hypothetical protein
MIQFMIVTLDSKRRLTLPEAIGSVYPGDRFVVLFGEEENTFTLRPESSGADWLAVLRACPVPMDDIPARGKARRRRRQ